jgi:hypothetical protein
MTYGQEVPFTDGFCPNNTDCTVSVGTAVTVTNTFSLNAGVSVKKRDISADDPIELEATFNIGASYSYSKSLTFTVSTTLHEYATPNLCGYWTLIPYMMG